MQIPGVDPITMDWLMNNMKDEIPNDPKRVSVAVQAPRPATHSEVCEFFGECDEDCDLGTAINEDSSIPPDTPIPWSSPTPSADDHFDEFERTINADFERALRASDPPNLPHPSSDSGYQTTHFGLSDQVPGNGSSTQVTPVKRRVQTDGNNSSPPDIPSPVTTPMGSNIETGDIQSSSPNVLAPFQDPDVLSIQDGQTSTHSNSQNGVSLIGQGIVAQTYISQPTRADRSVSEEHTERLNSTIHDLSQLAKHNDERNTSTRGIVAGKPPSPLRQATSIENIQGVFREEHQLVDNCTTPQDDVETYEQAQGVADSQASPLLSIKFKQSPDISDRQAWQSQNLVNTQVENDTRRVSQGGVVSQTSDYQPTVQAQAEAQALAVWKADRIAELQQQHAKDLAREERVVGKARAKYEPGSEKAQGLEPVLAQRAANLRAKHAQEDANLRDQIAAVHEVPAPQTADFASQQVAQNSNAVTSTDPAHGPDHVLHRQFAQASTHGTALHSARNPQGVLSQQAGYQAPQLTQDSNVGTSNGLNYSSHGMCGPQSNSSGNFSSNGGFDQSALPQNYQQTSHFNKTNNIGTSNKPEYLPQGALPQHKDLRHGASTSDTHSQFTQDLMPQSIAYSSQGFSPSQYQQQTNDFTTSNTAGQVSSSRYTSQIRAEFARTGRQTSVTSIQNDGGRSRKGSPSDDYPGAFKTDDDDTFNNFEESQAFNATPQGSSQSQFQFNSPTPPPRNLRQVPAAKVISKKARASGNEPAAPTDLTATKPKRKPSGYKHAQLPKGGKGKGFIEEASYSDLPPHGRRTLSYKDICRIDDIAPDNTGFYNFIRFQDMQNWDAKGTGLDIDKLNRWQILPARPGRDQDEAAQAVQRYKGYLIKGQFDLAIQYMDALIDQVCATPIVEKNALYLAFANMGYTGRTVLGKLWVEPETQLPDAVGPPVDDDDQSIEANEVRRQWHECWKRDHQINDAVALIMRKAGLAQLMMMMHTKSISDPVNGQTTFGLGLSGFGPAPTSGSGKRKTGQPSPGAVDMGSPVKKTRTTPSAPIGGGFMASLEPPTTMRDYSSLTTQKQQSGSQAQNNHYEPPQQQGLELVDDPFQSPRERRHHQQQGNLDPRLRSDPSMLADSAANCGRPQGQQPGQGHWNNQGAATLRSPLNMYGQQRSQQFEQQHYVPQHQAPQIMNGQFQSQRGQQQTYEQRYGGHGYPPAPHTQAQHMQAQHMQVPQHMYGHPQGQQQQYGSAPATHMQAPQYTYDQPRGQPQQQQFGYGGQRNDYGAGPAPVHTVPRNNSSLPALNRPIPGQVGRNTDDMQNMMEILRAQREEMAAMRAEMAELKRERSEKQ